MEKELQNEIATVAYSLFEKRGYTHGHDMEDWIAAENIVSSRNRKSVGTKSTKPSPKRKKNS